LAAILPVIARSQPREGARRLGVLSALSERDPIWSVNVAALTEALAAFGWHDGDNIRIDWRGASGDRALMARFAEELIAHDPDVILAMASGCVSELRARTKTIPVVFAFVTDPVGQGFVESFSHPGGNITGFSDNELSMAGKWLSLLAQITPAVKRVAVLYNPATAPFAEMMLRTITDAAPALDIVVKAEPVHDLAGIAAAVAALQRESAGGLLVLTDSFTIANRAAIIKAAATAHLPAIYWNRAFAKDGGLMSYGVDNPDLLRRSATYIDRILKGAKPADLPVQNPTKFEFVINLRTAKALGVTIAPSLLSSADEVIE